MAQPKITLYVDVVSPFAYIAFYVLQVSFLVLYGRYAIGGERTEVIPGGDWVMKECRLESFG